jgi:error-prone DNA polymerase
VPGDYVELRSRSAFSFLDGASNPEDLAERAAELGHEALALADRDGLYGIPRFHAAAAKAGLRAIVGAELSDAAGHPLQLLVESPAGYRNLSRLLTRAQSNAPKGEGRVGWDEIEEHASGLVALIPAEGVSSDASRGGPGARWSGSKAQQETSPDGLVPLHPGHAVPPSRARAMERKRAPGPTLLRSWVRRA